MNGCFQLFATVAQVFNELGDGVIVRGAFAEKSDVDLQPHLAREDARTLLVLGAVGEGAGIEFLSWLANMDLPKPEDVLADPDGFALPERSDRAFAERRPG